MPAGKTMSNVLNDVLLALIDPNCSKLAIRKLPYLKYNSGTRLPTRLAPTQRRRSAGRFVAAIAWAAYQSSAVEN